MTSQPYDLFVSYRSDNLDLAESLYNRLINEGFRVWFDKARLNPGCNWHTEIEEGCNASRIILPVLTPSWKQSEWTQFETYGAEFVIPLLYEDDWEAVAPVPLWEYQFLDLRDPQGGTWQKLFDNVRRYLIQPRPTKDDRFAFMPYAHNPNFVGREESLLEIHEKLCRAPTTVLTQGSVYAVAGMGGVGKTTLAREYAEKFWRLYQNILWVRAETGSLATEFARLALEMKLVREPSQDANLDAQRALTELCRRTRRLLVIDNATDEEAIQQWIPNTGGCRTIITSRFTGWSPAVQTIRVYVLEPKPAQELLLKRSGLPDTDANRAEADRVAKELGYLPLALEHAGAFVREAKKTSFNQYLKYYAEAKSRRDMMARRVLGSSQYPDSVATTWLVTIERLRPLARSIVTLISFLAPDDIPRSLVAEAGDLLREGVLELQPASAKGEVEVALYFLDQALVELDHYSMISLSPESLSIHRLVQAVQRDGFDEASQRLGAEYAVRIVDHAFPDPEFPNWPTCKILLSHASVCSEYIKRLNLYFPEAARLLHRVGSYLDSIGQSSTAKLLLEQALHIRKRTVGPKHLDVAETLSELAWAHESQGNYKKMEMLLKRAYVIHKKIFGPEHTEVASTLTSLAWSLRMQARYKDAELLYIQALAIRERELDPNHLDFVGSLEGLALVYDDLGNPEKAEPLYLRALTILERELDPHHPRVATCLNNMALVYRAQMRFQEAEMLHRRALGIREKVLGLEHPDVSQSLSNLANLLSAQAHYEEAEGLYRRALAIDEKNWGKNHPGIAITLNNLALLLYKQGSYMEAESLHRRSLEIKRLYNSSDHPSFALGFYNLALVLEKLGQFEEAESLFQEALTIDKKAYGPNHSEVLSDLIILAKLYVRRGRYHEAQSLYQEVLAIQAEQAGDDVLEVASSLQNLVRIYLAQKCYAEAEAACKRSLEILKRRFGEVHPEFATVLIDLAVIYQGQERYSDAEPLLKKALGVYEQELPPDDLRLGTLLHNLALQYMKQGRNDDAETLFQRYLAIEEKANLINSDTATRLNNVARFFQDKNDHDTALRLCRKALEIDEEQLDPMHPEIAVILNNLGLSLVCRAEPGDLEKAEQHLLRAIQILTTSPYPYYWLAKLYQKRGSPEDHGREALAWDRYLELGAPDDKRKEEALVRLRELSSQ
jgi:tetratricopeptide (TPR) repeat protein